MKKVKQLISVLFLMGCIVFASIQAMAADESLGKIVDGSVLTNKNEVESVVYPWARGSYLSNGTGHLVITGLGQVTVSGSTTAYQNVDEIKVTLTLQRMKSDESGWVYVSSFGPKTAKNTNFVSNSKSYSVTRGYYYRVYGGHTAIKDGKVESLTSYTDGVWIS